MFVRMARNRHIAIFVTVNYLSLKTIGKVNFTGTALPSSVLPGAHAGDAFTAHSLFVKCCAYASENGYICNFADLVDGKLQYNSTFNLILNALLRVLHLTINPVCKCVCITTFECRLLENLAVWNSRSSLSYCLLIIIMRFLSFE